MLNCCDTVFYRDELAHIFALMRRTSLFNRFLPALTLVVFSATAIAQVNTFPYIEDFDGTGGQLVQSTADAFDWTQLSGPTLSQFTGPAGDHTTGSGNYMYTEATANFNNTAILESPTISGQQINGIPNLSFWYYMYGLDMGTLTVEINYNSVWTPVWTLSGDQGQVWTQASIDLPDYSGKTFQYRFVGTTGADYRSDICIDDIVVDGSGACQPTFVNTCASNDYVDEVTFANIFNNVTGCDAAGTYNYYNYSGIFSTDVDAGSSYNLTVGVGGFNEYMGAWFDWNQDGDFQDAGEFFDLGVCPSNSTITQSITIPANAALGFTLMRIMANYSTVLTQGSLCSGQNYGEVEDYGINVLASCIPTYSNPCTSNDYIDDVTFNTISNLNTGCGNPGASNYTDYSAQSTSVVQSLSYDLSVGVANFNQYVGAWFDWNNDGDYTDAGEFTDLGLIPSNTTGTVSVTVPAGATVGSTTMRVVSRFNSPVLVQSDWCISASYGETEDYTVIVAAATGTDLSVTDILAPTSDCHLSASDSIIIDLSNVGTATITSFSFSYSINGASAITGAGFGSVAPGSTATYTFATPGNFSADGIYSIQAWCTIAGDNNQSNDTATVVVENEPSVSGYPYVEPFTTFPVDNATFGPFAEPNPGVFPNGWQNQLNDGADWYGRSTGTGSTGTGPTADNTTGTGTYVFVEDGGNNNVGVGLLRPCLDLSNLSSPRLEYYVSSFNNNGASDNYLVVELYYNGQWNEIDSVGGLASIAWTQRDIDLSGYPGWVDLRWRVNNSGADFQHDIAIDDVNVYDAAIFAVQPQDTTACNFDNPTFSVVLANGYDGTNYQWQADAGGGWYNIVDGFYFSGTETDVLTALGVDNNVIDGYLFRCLVTTVQTPTATPTSAATLTVTTDTTSVSLGSDFDICPGANVSVDAGSGFVSYQWNTGSSAQSITTDTVCYYTVSMNDLYGDGWNGGFLTLNIGGTAHTLSASGFGTDTTFTVLDGQSIAVNYTAGNWEAENSYSITTDQGVVLISDGPVPATGAVYSATASCPAVAYSVTVVDANGCVAEDTVLVTFTNSIAVDLGNDTTFCSGGAITLDAGSATAYSWSSGETTQTISVSTTGTYTVTVTSGSCTGTDDVNITVNATPAPSIADVGFCPGTAPTIDAGSGFASYSWSTGATTQALVVPATGTYTVTVTAGNGCTGVDTANATLYPSPAPALGADTGICIGSSAALDPGTFASYLWSTGATSQVVNPTAAGTYTVTVTDANSCTATDELVVTVNNNPTVALGPDITICDGANTPVDAGSGFSSYAWSNGDATQMANVNSSGTYTVTVTDNNSCTATDDIGVTSVVSPTIDLGNDSAFCQGGSVTLDAGPGLTYLWDDGSTGQQLAINSSGTYTVTVTNTNSCTATDSYTLTVNSLPAPNLGPDAGICVNGTASVDAGAFASYSWSDASTSQVLATATPGTYTVTVTDINGCSGSDDIVLSALPDLAPVTTLSTPASCGAADGTASATAAAGTAPFTYAWSSGGTAQVESGLAAGNYTVSITDANGCTTSEVASVGNANAPTITVTGTDLTCNGDGTGTAAVAATGGTMPYTYTWSNGSSSQSQTNLPAGSYAISVTDGGGCVATGSVTLTEPAALTASVAVTDASCGANDGDATVTAGGGTTPYTYAWSTGGVSNAINAVGAGSYTITLTDAAGCSITSSANIGNVGAPTLAISGSDVTCPGGNDGSANVTATGGVTPYAYIWSNGSTTAMASPLTEGSYTVTVASANGCNAISSVTVSAAFGLPTVDLGPDEEICSGDVVLLDAGSGFASYNWSDFSSGQTNSVSAAGTVSVQVIDNNGCSNSDTVNITVNALPVVNLGSDFNLCPGESATLDAGSGHPVYAWSTGATTQQITISTAGTYTVTVENTDGCVASSSITSSVPPAMTIVSNVVPASCGQADGSGVITVSAGTSPYTYLWSNGNTTSINANVIAGVYFCTVTDASGCGLVEQFNITNTGAPTLSLISNNVTCFGAADGTALVTATGGAPPYTYTWSNGATTAAMSGVGGGVYTIDVTDATGCVGSDAVTITEPTELVVSTFITEAGCGVADGSASASVTGGTVPYAYSWSDILGQTTATATGLLSGAYTVSITDGIGCTNTASATVTNANGPSVTLSTTDVDCEGDNNGVAAATVTGGTTPYSYIWNDPSGQTVAVATSLEAGNYELSVTDANSCLVVESTTVVALNATPVVDLGPDVELCPDATVTLDAGSFTSYLWSDASTSQTLEVSGPVTVSVTVTDLNGCMGSDTAQVDTITCTGIAELATRGRVAVYPNPSSGAFSIAFEDVTPGTAETTILNSMGQLVYTARIPVSGAVYTERLVLDLAAGIYHVRMVTANGMYQQRIVIE